MCCNVYILTGSSHVFISKKMLSHFISKDHLCSFKQWIRPYQQCIDANNQIHFLLQRSSHTLVIIFHNVEKEKKLVSQQRHLKLHQMQFAHNFSTNRFIRTICAGIKKPFNMFIFKSIVSEMRKNRIGCFS